MKSLCLAIGILAFSGIASAATIYVPDDYPTIQSAIIASVNGDTIIVRPGTYAGPVTPNGKAIVIRSEQGPQVTTIDGDYDSGVIFMFSEGRDTVLDGFTITNGRGTHWTKRSGGGIACRNSSPTIINNIIGLNDVSDGYGGGIFCEKASPRIESNIIRQNNASYGGGIHCYNASPEIVNNIISENEAEFPACGGGIYISNGSEPFIFGNTISSNKAKEQFGGYGGGIYSTYSAPQIVSNRFFLNSATHGGGAIASFASSPRVVNNLIYENKAGNYGGGIAMTRGSSMEIINCTIVGNFLTGGGYGGGLFVTRYSEPKLINSIVWYNRGQYGTQIAVTGKGSDASTLSLGHSTVTDNSISVCLVGASKIEYLGGNIRRAPQLVDPTNYDFHLTWQSPCRDSGHNAYVDELCDFEGDERITGATVDMGADEYAYHLYHTGSVAAGSPIDLKVIGFPTAPVTFFLGDGLADPPHATQHGDFYLNWPVVWQGFIGAVPGNGVLVFPTTVPTAWSSGSEHPIQALVGPWGGPSTGLTNYENLIVE